MWGNKVGLAWGFFAPQGELKKNGPSVCKFSCLSSKSRLPHFNKSENRADLQRRPEQWWSSCGGWAKGWRRPGKLAPLQAGADARKLRGALVKKETKPHRKSASL